MVLNLFIFLLAAALVLMLLGLAGAAVAAFRSPKAGDFVKDLDRRWIFLLMLLSVMIPVYVIGKTKLTFPEKVLPLALAVFDEIEKLDEGDKVLLACTGSQGEPTSALVRIANKDHRDISVIEGDTVIISATPIPGNELGVGRTIDNLMRQGATVLYDRISTVHVHGHASQEELKMMLNLVRPRYFVPVHGEYRHLMAHAQLAQDVGVAQSGIFVLEDGDVLELSEDGARMEEKVSARRIYVDGANRRDHRSQVFRQRRTLSKDGVVVVIVSTDKESGRLVGEPKAVASGFMEDSETEELFQNLALTLSRTLAGDPGLADQPDRLKSKMRETAREFLASETNRRPIIIPVVLEV